MPKARYLTVSVWLSPPPGRWWECSLLPQVAHVCGLPSTCPPTLQSFQIFLVRPYDRPGLGS